MSELLHTLAKERSPSSCPSMRKFAAHSISVLACIVLAVPTAWATRPKFVAMTESQWRTANAKSNIQFLQMEGFPKGLMDVKAGSATLNGMTLANGTIEFDAKLTGNGTPGIRFHQVGRDSAEQIYLRPGADCAASQDCLQYAPIMHGAMLWDAFPQYQRPAPLFLQGWNHFKIVISGRRMNVYVNNAASPTLAVGRLEADATNGEIQVSGPATFANFRLAPGAVDGLSARPVTDITERDGRYIRNWYVSPFFVLPNGKSLISSELPTRSTLWRRPPVERNGFVNLSRLYKTPDPGTLRCVAWLKTTIRSDQDQEKGVSIGWLREVWIFVNGKPVFSGRNFWDPPGPKLTPDGRLSLDNGSFMLPLQKGTNEIYVAISNEESDSATHFGWGLELRLADRNGLMLKE
jgi:hypothetical protein